MKAWTLRDQQTLELTDANGVSFGHVGLKHGRNGRAELALSLRQEIRIKPAQVCVSELARREQIAEPSRPAA